MQSNELLTAIRAGYAFFYVETSEMSRAIDEIKAEVKAYTNGGENLCLYSTQVWDFEANPDPEDCLRTLENSDVRTIVIAKNFNWFLIDEVKELNKQFVTFLQNRIETFSTSQMRKVLIIMGSDPFDKAIPSCLQKDFMPIEFALPGPDEIREILESIIKDAEKNPNFSVPSRQVKRRVIDSSKGMSKREILNAYAFSIIKNEGTLDPRTVAEIQAKEIEKTAGLSLGRYETKFEDLIGMDNIKEFFLNTHTSPLAKGLLLVGVAGGGKTMFGECAGGVSGMKVLSGEMAQLFGKFVGESESLMKRWIDIVKANAPCILFIDEIEKALAGVGGGGQSGDGGTTKRSMAQFLKFLSDDREREGVYVIATCNDIRALPPEWVRAERWDTAPFFIDLPNSEERGAILKHYQKVYDVSGKPKNMKGWSGAEIKSACRIAKMMSKKVNEVEPFIVPVSSTMKDEIESLRKWSKGKTIPATTAAASNGSRSLDL